MRKMCLESNFKTRIQKGKRIIVKEEHDGGVNVCVFNVFSLCLMKEQPGCFVIISVPIIKVWRDIVHIY